MRRFFTDWYATFKTVHSEQEHELSVFQRKPSRVTPPESRPVTAGFTSQVVLLLCARSRSWAVRCRARPPNRWPDRAPVVSAWSLRGAGACRRRSLPAPLLCDMAIALGGELA